MVKRSSLYSLCQGVAMVKRSSLDSLCQVYCYGKEV